MPYAPNVVSEETQVSRYGVAITVRPTVRLTACTHSSSVCPETGKHNTHQKGRKFSMSASRWNRREPGHWGQAAIPTGSGVKKRSLITHLFGS